MPNIINISNDVSSVEHFGFLVFIHNNEQVTGRISRVFDSKIGDTIEPVVYRMSCAYYSGSTADNIQLQGTNAEDSPNEPSTTGADWVTIDTVTALSANRMRNDEATEEKITSGYRYYRFRHTSNTARCAGFGVIGFANNR